MWNCSFHTERNIPRTNNAIEGWHNTFRNTFKTSKYSLILLIRMLKNEEDVVRIEDVRLSKCFVLRRLNKYIRREERVDF